MEQNLSKEKNLMNAWQRYKEKLGTTRPWDFINPNTEYATIEDESTRMSLCMDCPELIKVTKQCKQCGCFMNLKVKLKEAQCPLKKW